MSETRVMRTLALPLAVAVIFLVFTPRLCSRAIVNAKKQQQVAPVQASSSGLVIQPSGPSPAPSGLGGTHIQFPPGLDATRIQYLVEIDQSFAAPITMTAREGSPLARVLLERGYIEKRADGTLGPTREGLINVNGAIESKDGWIVPVAKRTFISVDGLEDAGDGRYNAWVKWRWEPNAIGAAMLANPQDHHLKAQFAGGDHNWVLARYIEPPDSELR